METISTSQAAEMIRHSGGKLFSVSFEKRTKPGVIRRMVARVAPKNGWKTGVNGKDLAFNPSEHLLIPVREFVSLRDMRDGRMRSMGTQFRSVSIDAIRSLRIAGKRFSVA